MTETCKVYIKGVPDRGAEVIKMLEDLGAVNHWDYTGDSTNGIYYIRHDGYIGLIGYKTEFAQIIMDNYRELHLLWKDGDILVDNDTPNRFVVKLNVWNDGNFKAYLFVNQKFIQERPIVTFRDADYHKADSEELRKFHELLHKHGKEWDADKKQLVDWKWKPKAGEKYFFISCKLSVGRTFNNGLDIDKDLIHCGNCFRTYEEAEVMAEKIKKLLKGK